MKVIDAFQRNKPTISFEFFPPKTPEQEEQLFQVLGQLKPLQPDFVSVTYGAMGKTRDHTFSWVDRIKREFQLEPVAHLTCINASRADVAKQLDQLAALGINNILALRGDPPADQPGFIPPANGFRFAKELIAFIKKHPADFCVGAAGFPEARTENFLKEKVDAGAAYVISQLFFDNQYFFAFLERCHQLGINVPVIPGLMPITSFKQIQRLTSLCGAALPQKLLAALEKHQADTAAIRQIGYEQALKQSQGLLAAGVKGIHFFVMNQAEPFLELLGKYYLPKRAPVGGCGHQAFLQFP